MIVHLVTAWDRARNAAKQHLPQIIPAEKHTRRVIRLMHMLEFVDRVDCEQHLHDNDGDNSPPMKITTLNTIMLMQTCLSSGRKSLAAMISLFSCLMTRSQSMPFWLACRARAHRRSRHAAFTTFARPTSSTRPNVCACGQLTRQVTSGNHCTSPACNPTCPNCHLCHCLMHIMILPVLLPVISPFWTMDNKHVQPNATCVWNPAL